MKSNFIFTFSAGTTNDHFMTLVLKVNNQFSTAVDVKSTFEVSAEITLPAMIEFHINGRTNSDTIVVNGKIIADKFIKLEKIDIDKFVVDAWQLPEEFLTFHTLDYVTSTDYWGRNGVAKLVINQDDPALWFLECPKII